MKPSQVNNNSQFTRYNGLQHRILLHQNNTDGIFPMAKNQSQRGNLELIKFAAVHFHASSTTAGGFSALLILCACLF